MKLYKLLFIVIILTNSACKKLVEVDTPITSISSVNVYSSDATAAAVLTGIYTNMSSISLSSGGLTSLSLYPDLSADELTLITGTGNSTYIGYFTNALTNSNTIGADFWNSIYPIIFITNAAIEGLNTANNLTPSVKQQLMGEAKFMRAFCYFYLVNLYGDVPLVTGTNYTTNAVLTRTPKVQVWQQIITDLKDAQSLMSTNYLDATLLNTTLERVRPTTWAAAALLARSYLYTQKWDSAEATATSVINNASLYSLSTLKNAFLANNTEAIWQLQPVIFGLNTQEAIQFKLPANGPNTFNYPFYLSSLLLNAFEPGDQRRVNWVDSVIAGGVTYYYPFKYKIDSLGAPVSEYEMVLRLGEQYLIRAEAEANGTGGTGAAISDLNVIRNRAGLPNYSGASDPTSVSNAIYHERQVELFTEWGHRWLDLKRTGMVDTVMGTGGACAAKGGTWNTNWQWYPISLYELQHDPNLQQNSGY